MIATILATAMIFGGFWMLMRMGRRNTRGWWLRDYFSKVAFYVAIFIAMVVGRRFDFPSRLLIAIPAALMVSVLIASLATLIYHFRVVKKQAHLVPKGTDRIKQDVL